jgi:RNA polymerase sigma factor (sigma-70 family)
VTETLGFRQRGGMDNTSSADLLRECGQKLTDAVLWQQFEDRFHRTIMTYVLRVVRSRSRDENLVDARDLVQEVYVRLIANNGRWLRSFKGHTDFAVKAFLSRVTVSVVSDFYRSERAEKRRSAEIISIDDARRQQDAGDAVDVNIPAVLSVIDVERLMDVELDRRNAARNVLIFKLHVVDGLTIKEIAQFPSFDLKEKAIGVIIQNLKTSLKKRMGL